MIVKICGLTREVDVKAACELGADMTGVVLVEGSKRKVGVDRARELLSVSSSKRVAVCRPRTAEELLELDRKLKPDYLQLHPGTTGLEEVRKKISAGLILVVSIPPEGARLEDLISQSSSLQDLADFILLDTKGPHGGGTGIPHDWSLSAEIRKRLRVPVLLAGGLNPSNVERVAVVVRPAGVDVATGVELAPGIKDPKLMREFIRKAKEARS